MMTERDQLTFARLQPVFAEHAVPEQDRLFLYRAFCALVEDDYEHPTAAEAVERAILPADTYEELLLQHDRGHRKNRSWFTSAYYDPAVPTRRGRDLLRALAAVNPNWQDAEAA